MNTGPQSRDGHRGAGDELDRRLFHLKTLYDVSADILSRVDSDAILRDFLLMTMGSFGVVEGFVALDDSVGKKPPRVVGLGFPEEGLEALKAATGQAAEPDPHAPGLPFGVACALPFSLADGTRGLVALGEKLVGEPYDAADRELLGTLVNNLVIALKNAASFEEIQRLNRDLQSRNEELLAALRKVEILESVKANLSKFVPNAVTRMIDASPDGRIPDGREQDVSVLFVDIQGYTRMCESLGGALVAEVIEKCFSVFMDAIYANQGDVNETAGDGLMVLFLDEDTRKNAAQAVRTARAIREEAARVRREFEHLSVPLAINMGINSGPALVGAARFESYTGSRWTYTARGTVTNVAARIGALATDGRIFLSPTTAERVRGEYPAVSQGRVRLKNVSEEVEIFEV